MFSNDKNIETVGQLVDTIKHYVGLQTEYLKFDIVDKVVRLLTALTILVVLLGLLAVAMIYLSFALAFSLAGWVGLPTAFCIVAAAYILLLGLFILFRHKWIEKPLVKFLAGLLMQK